MAEQRMNFYRSFYDLATMLPERERQRVCTALLDFFFEGTEPEGLTANGMKVFNGCRGRIEASRRNAENALARYKESDAEPDKSQPAKRHAEPDKSQPAKSGVSQGTEGEGDREIEREGERAGTRAPAPEGFEPPTLGEVRSYFGANCLPGDPDAFWAYYDGQGWVKANGQPVVRWTSEAVSWSRRQRGYDAAKPERQRSAEEQAASRPLGTSDYADRLAKRIGSDYEVVGNTLVRKRAKSDAKRQIE